jgi:putative pyruvate formate lyase activating enzyme
VYNCGGYEPLEVLQLLDGIVDVYLADFKYTDPTMAETYGCGARDYPEIAAGAIAEMRLLRLHCLARARTPAPSGGS